MGFVCQSGKADHVKMFHKKYPTDYDDFYESLMKITKIWSHFRRTIGQNLCDIMPKSDSDSCDSDYSSDE